MNEIVAFIVNGTWAWLVLVAVFVISLVLVAHTKNIIALIEAYINREGENFEKKVHSLSEQLKAEHLEEATRRMVREELNSMIFKRISGMENNKKMRERIMLLIEKSNGKLTVLDFRRASPFITMESGKFIVQYSLKDNIMFFLNTLSSLICLCLSLSFVLLLPVVSNLEFASSLAMWLAGCVLFAVSIFFMLQNKPHFAVQHIRRVIEELKAAARSAQRMRVRAPSPEPQAIELKTHTHLPTHQNPISEPVKNAKSRLMAVTSDDEQRLRSVAETPPRQPAPLQKPDPSVTAKVNVQPSKKSPVADATMPKSQASKPIASPNNPPAINQNSKEINGVKVQSIAHPESKPHATNSVIASRSSVLGNLINKNDAPTQPEPLRPYSATPALDEAEISEVRLRTKTEMAMEKAQTMPTNDPPPAVQETFSEVVDNAQIEEETTPQSIVTVADLMNMTTPSETTSPTDNVVTVQNITAPHSVAKNAQPTPPVQNKNLPQPVIHHTSLSVPKLQMNNMQVPNVKATSVKEPNIRLYEKKQ